MRKLTTYLFLVLLIAAISISPRFSFGYVTKGRSLDIRIEDLLLLAASIFLFFYIVTPRKHNFDQLPLFWPIYWYLLFGFFGILVSLIFARSSLGISFFYFLKEVEFFVLYFIVFLCVARFDLSRKLMEYWLFFSLVNIFWIFYVFIFDVGSFIYYGPDAFSEPRGPFPSGGFFLLLFVFFFNFFIFYYNKLKVPSYKKAFVFLLSVLPVVGVVLSGSVTSNFGLLVSLAVSLFLFLKNKISFIKIAEILFFLILISGLLFVTLSSSNLGRRIFSLQKIKNEYFSYSGNSRISILRNNMKILKNNPSTLIMGMGVLGEAHDQYIRVLLEKGITGLFMFFWLIYSILKISYKGFKEKDDLFKKSLCAGLFVSTVAMLVMAIPNDVFMVVKVDEVYWFFAAMTMASIFSPWKSSEITLNKS